MTEIDFSIDGIKRISEKVNLEKHITDEAILNYKLLKRQNNVFSGFLHDQISLAIIFLVCKKHNLKFTLESLDSLANSFSEKVPKNFIKTQRKIRLTKTKEVIQKILKIKLEKEETK